MDQPVYRSLSVESSAAPSLSLESSSVRSAGHVAPSFSKSDSDFSKQSTASTLKSLGPLPLRSAKSVDSLSFDSLSFSSITSASQSPTSPILDCPVYYEPNSSFLANKTPSAIFDSILLQLTKNQIIHRFSPLKSRIHGLMYSSVDAAPCTFKINLFKAPKNTKKANFLVEVQRRYGCVVLFRRFYQQMLQVLTTEGVAISLSASSALSVTPPAPSSISLDKEAVEDLFRNLGNPAKLGSVTLESLRETLRVFVTVSKTSQNRLALLSSTTNRSKLLDIILNALQLSDSEVKRCGATLLCNMASVESLRSELVSKLVSCMFELLENAGDSGAAGFASSSLIDTEIQRQIAQALVILTQTNAVDVSRQTNYSHFVEILNKQKFAPDDLFRENVQKILQQLTCD